MYIKWLLNLLAVWKIRHIPAEYLSFSFFYSYVISLKIVQSEHMFAGKS